VAQEPDFYDIEITLQTLKYATRQLVAELDVERVVFHALHSIADFSNSGKLSLLLLNSDSTSANVAGILIDGEFSTPNEQISIRNTPLAEVFETKQSGTYDILKKTPYPIPTSKIFHTKSKCKCLPLVGTNHKVNGFINFEEKSSQIIHKNHQEILTVLTTLIAMTLENARLFQLATIDGLTGLYVRRYFDIRLKEEITRLKRIDSNLAIIMMDIDHFKSVNDTFGHQQGDIVLTELASILKNAIRRDLDIPCRYGGEEFVAILPGTDQEGAIVLAERIRKRCEDFQFRSLSDDPIRITISGGVASINSNSIITKEELFKIADKKLYEAKQAGRNRVRF
jgi:diguanylate cyclase (GGDEF)-like protein